MAGNIARRLRSQQTEAERRLWLALRDRRLAGYKFRRQCPIGPYVADFVSIRHRLIIEVDGSQHTDSIADDLRTRRLEAGGWRVICIWNNDVSTRLSSVRDHVFDVLQTQRTLTLPARRAGPLPLPQAGEGS